MQKLTKKLSLVMVALMTVFTALSYVPAKAATVVPQVQFAGEQKTEFTAGERITFNLNAANYGGRVQYRVVLWNDATKSYSDLWNTADKYYANWMPYGNETLPLGWVINEPGTYRITVYAKRAGLANNKTALKGSNCDSFLAGPAFVVKPAAATPDSIAPVADVTVEQGATPVLPTTVTLNLVDKTTKTAKVTWAAVDTTKVGTYAVEGTVEGTELKAKVNVVVTAQALDVKSVSAVTNTRVDVVLNKAVTIVDKANFAIKDAAGTELAVTSATLSADGKTVKLITAAQTAGVKYTLTVKGTGYTFIGQLADTVKPSVVLANSLTDTVVEVTFDENMDESALNTANYTIDGLTVAGANFKVNADGSVNKKVVQLTTSAQTAAKLYKVVVANATDIAGNVVKDTADEFMFGGKGADTAKPTVSTIVSSFDGNKVSVKFNDDSLLDVATMGNAANYAIEGLQILSVEVVSNELGISGEKEVVLTTAAQTASKLYYVEVKNVKDTAGNVMDTKKVPFGGSAADTTKLDVTLVTAVTNTTVEVRFNDLVDATTALNVANYSIDGLTITGVAEDADATEATNVNPYNRTSVYTLTTSAQTGSKLYYLVVKNVTDDKGNVQVSTEVKVPFGGKAADTTKPVVGSAVSSNKNTIIVSFTEDSKLDKASATNPLNYVFDGGLGYPVSASLDATGKVVTLKTADQTASKAYKLTVSNVADLSGNVADSKVLTFIGKGDTDTAAPKVESVIALDRNTLQVVFTKKVASANTAGDYSVTASTKTGYTLGVANGAVALSDGKTVLLTFTTNPFDYGYAYDLTVANTNIVNAVDSTQKLYTTNSANVVKFAGNGATNALPTIAAVIALDATHLKVVFSEPVTATGSLLKIVGINDDDTAAAVQTATYQSISTDGLEAIYAHTALPTTASVYKAYVVNVDNVVDRVSNEIEAKSGSTGVSKVGVAFAASTAAVDALKIDYIMGVDNHTVDIYFNKDVNFTELATDDLFATITDQSGNALTSAITFDHAIQYDTNIIRAYFTEAFEASKVYTLTIANGANGTNLITDNDAAQLTASLVANTTANAKVFAANGTAQEKVKIASVEAIAYNKVKVTFNQLLDSTKTAANVIADLTITAPGAIVPSVTGVLGSDGMSITLTLTNGMFSADDEYTVAIATNAQIENAASVALSADTTSTAKFRGLFTPAITGSNVTLTIASGAPATATLAPVIKMNDGRVLAKTDLTITDAVTGTGAMTSDQGAATITAVTGVMSVTVTEDEAAPATAANDTYVLTIKVNGTSASYSFTVTAQ